MAEKDANIRLKDQLCFPIYLCAKEITRKYTALLDKYDLTYTQYIVMMFFWEKKTSNVRELGETLMLDPSTLTPLLKKLEAKGYIIRSRSSSDERNLSITLTDEGTALEQKVLPIHDEMCGCIGLDQNDAKTLYTLIFRILENVRNN